MVYAAEHINKDSTVIDTVSKQRIHPCILTRDAQTQISPPIRLTTTNKSPTMHGATWKTTKKS